MTIFSIFVLETVIIFLTTKALKFHLQMRKIKKMVHQHARRLENSLVSDYFCFSHVSLIKMTGQFKYSTQDLYGIFMVLFGASPWTIVKLFFRIVPACGFFFGYSFNFSAYTFFYIQYATI